MQISQENGNTTGTTTGYFAADQWSMYFIAAGAAFGLLRASGRLRFNVTTAKASMAAGEYVQLYQAIEGIRISDFKWGTASAKQVVLRFGFKGPAGTYAVNLRNGTTDRSFSKKFTITTANVDTEQVIIIPGDTIGVWAVDNTLGIALSFCPAVGTTYAAPAEGWNAGNFIGAAGQSNGIAATGTFELFDVGLYLDPNNTGVPPSWQMPDEADELNACMRYFQRGPTSTYGGYAAATSASVLFYFGYAAMVPMRVGPTQSLFGYTSLNAPAVYFGSGSPYGGTLYSGGTAVGPFWVAGTLNLVARM